MDEEGTNAEEDDEDAGEGEIVGSVPVRTVPPNRPSPLENA
jgi:hypothetical protein